MFMYEKELSQLADAGAKYLVIGAVALGLHGYVRATTDLDIFPELTSENLDKIIKTLTALGYASRVPVNPEELKNSKKRAEWYTEKGMKVFTFIDPKDPMNTVDLMIYPPISFADSFNKRKIVNINGREVSAASIDDLLAMKKSAMRDKDLDDIRVLEFMSGSKI